MITQNEIIQQVQSLYKNGIPNGILLGWDTARFHNQLTSLFERLIILNETDFNYSFCNSYTIELGKDSGDNVYILTLKASFIVNAYTIHVTKYSSNKRVGKVIQEDHLLQYTKYIERARSFFENQGFIEITSDDMDCAVNDVTLELAEKPTLGKCLFDDFE